MVLFIKPLINNCTEFRCLRIKNKEKRETRKEKEKQETSRNNSIKKIFGYANSIFRKHECCRSFR